MSNYTINLTPGQTFTWAKTVSESDVYLFAGITGDLSPNHVNEQYMRATHYGTRIAHGALILAYASAVSTQIQAHTRGNCVSYGYDRVRFLQGVPIGTTLTITFTIREVNNEELKVYSDVAITNDDDQLTCVATHILKYFPPEVSA